MNSSIIFKQSIVSALLFFSCISTVTKATDCPIKETKDCLQGIKNNPIATSVAIAVLATIAWVHKFRGRDENFTSRFDTNKLSSDPARQVLYFILDELLGHSGDTAAIKSTFSLDENGTGVITKQIIPPHGLMGNLLVMAQDCKDSIGAMACIAAVLTWVNSHTCKIA